ncbi:hypothetical protein [Alkalihalobacterium bogoriense]|uniref:hypothetical protein n=1 Tax=Alkalihalobacterium bogoriense TaxID=246272 RepID=UPI00047A2D0A|nr:hypothetical protein [Alkalihalobacterium bogoriense]
MSKHYDEPWEQLQQVRSTKEQKETTRTKILKTLEAHTVYRDHRNHYPMKSIVATTIFFMISGVFLWLILLESGQLQTAYEEPIGTELFTWKLDDVYPEKSDDGMLLYRKGNPVEVGAVKEVTEEEKNEIVTSLSMHVEETLGNFPYPGTMYIEHVKMDVSLRYHFFMAFTDEKWIHITFDYPQLEYAEIFYAMSTIEFKGKEPYVHGEQLYVTHGYGDLLYPVGLEPVSISLEKEIYHWSNASSKLYYDYLGKVVDGPGNWQQTTVDGLTHTFVHGRWGTELTITLDENEIIYEFVNHNREE